MNAHADNTTDFSAPSMIEGIARVVAVDGNMVWLEPEPSGGCGSCASSASCGTKGIGTPASKLEARRFRIENPANLVAGERVVIGIHENSLLKASITAYAIPLATLLFVGGLAQWQFASDFITMAAMIIGLVIGLAISRMQANRLHAQGDLAPQFIRRARMGETCNS